MKEARWTLDELAERVDAALAVDYQGQPSGRVRDVPDRRAIRWYTTIGLIDRPAAHRGRTALYGPRHLLQLVAVKRLQAAGLPLVAIQQRLAGATDSQLARVARLSGRPGLPDRPVPTTHPAAAASPATTTAAAAPGTADGAAPPARPAGLRAPTAKARTAGFWRDPPAAFAAGATAGAESEAGGDGPAGLATLRGLRLGEGATLLLEPGRELEAEDLRAVLDAAGPLLAALRDRGLVPASAEAPRREHP